MANPYLLMRFATIMNSYLWLWKILKCWIMGSLCIHNRYCLNTKDNAEDTDQPKSLLCYMHLKFVVIYFAFYCGVGYLTFDHSGDNRWQCLDWGSRNLQISCNTCLHYVLFKYYKLTHLITWKRFRASIGADVLDRHRHRYNSNIVKYILFVSLLPFLLTLMGDKCEKKW